MKQHNFFTVIILAMLTLSSCGDEELAPESNEYVNDTLPAYAIDAFNNAKRLYDNIGNIKEITYSLGDIVMTDEYGNTINIDKYGNTDIQTISGETIYIDNIIRESKITPNDTINNTKWIGQTLLYKSFVTIEYGKAQSFYDENTFFKYIRNAALYEETSFCNEKTDTIEEPTGYSELTFKNTACIICSWDTINRFRRSLSDEYSKIKLKEQEFISNGIRYRIDINNDTALLILYIFNNGIDETEGYELYPFEYQVLEKDSTFCLQKGTNVLKRELLERWAYHTYETFNYRLLGNGNICIFNYNWNKSSNEYENTTYFNLPIYDEFHRKISQKEVGFTKLK